MAEYIGSRISLISKRDIRYVGILHEISSENSTVALEQVKSYGTEGRSEEEVPPSDNVYEYIVFRGSDVKDLRIEKEPEKKSTSPPGIPDDPAILGNARPTASSNPQTDPSQQQRHNQQPQHQFPQRQVPAASHPGQLPQFQQHNYFPQGNFSQQHHRPGPYGAPQQFAHSPYGPPPGWYGPQGQAFGGPPPPHMQQPYPGHVPPHAALQQSQSRQTDTSPAAVISPTQPNTAAAGVQRNESTATTSSAQLIGASSKTENVDSPATPAKKAATTRNERIKPAVPQVLPSKVKSIAEKPPQVSKETPTGTNGSPDVNMSIPKPSLPKSMDEANQEAKAALNAAMAKFQPNNNGTDASRTTNDTFKDSVDNLTTRVSEMRTNDGQGRGRGRGRGGQRGGHRSGLRGGRGDFGGSREFEVPATDYDFESANAKFNKQELVREATSGADVIAGASGQAESTQEKLRDGVDTPTESLKDVSQSGYNKTTSFFDDISSESRDREGESGAKKFGGREFRNEEQKKNLETFGQGSVDGYRGRGRGRGGHRGGRGDARGAHRGPRNHRGSRGGIGAGTPYNATAQTM